MPLELGTARIPLVGAQENQAKTEAQARVRSVPSQKSGETLIVNLESIGETPVSGTATGIRLSQMGDYSTDPHDAIAEWIQELESFCIPEQGVGFTVYDEERDRQVRVIVTAVNWTFVYGAPYEVRWTLEATRGEGFLGTTGRSVSGATPNSTAKLKNLTKTPTELDLGSIDEKRTELSINVETTPIAYSDESEAIITPKSGQLRRITISGTKGGSLSTLREFDSTVRENMGSNIKVTYQTAFPGTTHEVVISQFDSTFKGGQPHTMDYAMTLLEGQIL